MTAIRIALGLIIIGGSQILNIQGAAHDSLPLIVGGLAGTLYGLWVIYTAMRDA